MTDMIFQLADHPSHDPGGFVGWLAANVLALLTLASTAVAGIFALRKWRSDEQWKRATAALERIKSFSETPGTRNAMMILKSRVRPIPLLDPASPPPDGTGIYRDVTWAEARDALVPTAWNTDGSAGGNAVRDSFEDFIDRMIHIEMYLVAGLLSEAEARPLVEPWAHRLRQDFDDGLAAAFRVYVECERKTSFQDLCLRFGVDLRSTIDADRQRMRVRLGLPPLGEYPD